MEPITSLQNPKVKNILLLQEKSRERKQQGLFVVEGERELRLAIEGGYTIVSLFCYSELRPLSVELEKLLPPDVQRYNISKAVFEKLAYRENSDGLIAVAKSKESTLESIKLPANPFIIILEAVEKPGNLGAILRTADAAQVDAIVVCDPLCDIYNPNVVRSSIGCLFTQQVAAATSEETLRWLKEKGISSYAAELTAAQWYHETALNVPCAIVMGTEADGLSDFWLTNATARIKIPMRGKIDSLNVSVATAIITFEAMRQRGFQHS